MFMTNYVFEEHSSLLLPPQTLHNPLKKSFNFFDIDMYLDENKPFVYTL